MHHALIIAGGAGSRLWPLSREGRPKHLLRLANGRSLLEEAWSRIDGLTERRCRWVCAEESWRRDVAGILTDLEPTRYIGEPEGRDTLAALAVTCAVIAREDPDAAVAVFTADHVIEPVEALHACVTAGFRLVRDRPEILLTFGVAPTSAHTGYGYLELGGVVGREGARAVACFREKPDREAASSFLADGPERFLWNSGMFLWNARTFLSHVEHLQPAVAEGAAHIAAAWGSPDLASVMSAAYATFPRISVDHGVMEPVSRRAATGIAVIPLSASWADVGSWSSYTAMLPHDPEGNVRQTGLTELVDCRGTAVVTTDPRHLVAAVGCDDLIIVHTPTATLVCRGDRADAVKQLQKRVAREHGSKFA